MAISKQRKDELVETYSARVKRSQALFVTEYTGMNMKQIDDLRKKLREAGGEFHIVKNTLSKITFENCGLPVSEQMLSGSSAITFAFQDSPGVAKAITEFARTSEFVKVKGGYLDKRILSAEDVKSLADLPPLPVMRAQLLGVMSAPASKLVRTLAEPARQIAAVIKAYADQDSATAAA